MARYRTRTAKHEAKFIWDAMVGAYALSFSYDAEFVALIKAFVPASHRDYDPKTYTWYIKEDYYQPFKVILLSHFPGAHIVEKPANMPSVALKPIESDVEVFARLSEKPLTEVQALTLVEATKLYRSLALKFHPDRAPDKAHIMSELNSVWPRLKQDYFK